jgi:hypothetical protein
MDTPMPVEMTLFIRTQPFHKIGKLVVEVAWLLESPPCYANVGRLFLMVHVVSSLNRAIRPSEVDDLINLIKVWQ